MQTSLQIDSLLQTRAQAHADAVALLGKPGTEERLADLMADIAYCNRQLERLGWFEAWGIKV